MVLFILKIIQCHLCSNIQNNKLKILNDVWLLILKIRINKKIKETFIALENE